MYQYSIYTLKSLSFKLSLNVKHKLSSSHKYSSSHRGLSEHETPNVKIRNSHQAQTARGTRHMSKITTMMKLLCPWLLSVTLLPEPLTARQPHAGKPWTLVSAPSAIPARTFENLSLCHNPPWLILLAWIQSTGQRLSHDHRSRDLHSSCPNIASIMTGTKGISAYQATDLPAILLWLVTLSFFFAWHRLHA